MSALAGAIYDSRSNETPFNLRSTIVRYLDSYVISEKAEKSLSLSLTLSLSLSLLVFSSLSLSFDLINFERYKNYNNLYENM